MNYDCQATPTAVTSYTYAISITLQAGLNPVRTRSAEANQVWGLDAYAPKPPATAHAAALKEDPRVLLSP